MKTLFHKPQLFGHKNYRGLTKDMTSSKNKFSLIQRIRRDEHEGKWDNKH